MLFETDKKSRRCSRCRRLNSKGAEFCGECGTELPISSYETLMVNLAALFFFCVVAIPGILLASKIGGCW